MSQLRSIYESIFNSHYSIFIEGLKVVPSGIRIKRVTLTVEECSFCDSDGFALLGLVSVIYLAVILL